jgi:hypothetical protein
MRLTEVSGPQGTFLGAYVCTSTGQAADDKSLEHVHVRLVLRIMNARLWWNEHACIARYFFLGVARR